MPTLINRLQHAWNAFTNSEPPIQYKYISGGYAGRPDRPRLSRGNEKSIITAVYNRIAIDVAAVKIQHVRLNDNGGLIEIIDSGLNDALNVEANIDQTGRELIQDIVLSMFDEGCVAVVPVDTTINPNISGSYDIKTMRTAKILEWFPQHVRVRVYNDRTGKKEELILSKNVVCIIENPFYSVMNEPNSTLQRLIRKLNLLDAIDEQSGSGKLDLIIQLPYVIKTKARQQQAETRRKDIEMQLAGSKYGIAYIDGAEHVTQLNRPVENNLMKQIEYLVETLYSQLGVTEEIIKGTADEKTMLNYYNGTIEPCLAAITNNMSRTFLTKTARTQNQTIGYFRDPFKLVPVNQIADIADKFTRNEILSSNEVRAIVGYRPVDDPRADELRNKNLNQSKQEYGEDPISTEGGYDEEEMAQMMSDFFLKHHGIEGQRWGVRNGPPYPLDTKTANRVKSGEQEKLRVSNKEYRRQRAEETDPEKLVGTSKLVNSIDRSWREVTVASDLPKPLNFADFPEDQREWHHKGDAKSVWYSDSGLDHGLSVDSGKLQGTINPGWGSVSGTTNNCAKCTAALALHAMGYEDVCAGRSHQGALHSHAQYWFDGARPYKEKGDKNIADRIESMGDRAFGEFSFSYPNGAGGHSIFFRKNKYGEVEFLDGQSGHREYGILPSKTKEYYDRLAARGEFNSDIGLRKAERYKTLEQVIGILRDHYGFDDTDAFVRITRLDDATPNWGHLSEDSVLRINYANKDMNKIENKKTGRLVSNW